MRDTKPWIFSIDCVRGLLFTAFVQTSYRADYKDGFYFSFDFVLKRITPWRSQNGPWNLKQERYFQRADLFFTQTVFSIIRVWLHTLLTDFVGICTKYKIAEACWWPSYLLGEGNSVDVPDFEFSAKNLSTSSEDKIKSWPKLWVRYAWTGMESLKQKSFLITH